MKSWLMSPDPIKAEKSLELLCKCEKLSSDTEMSLFDYNLALATCAKVRRGNQKQKNKAMGIGIEVFKKIQSSSRLQPSSQTYYSLIEACTNLIPNKSKQLNAVETFFDLCKRDGMVN